MVGFVFNETVGEFERETQSTLEREFDQIVGLYVDTGLRSVSQEMIVRSAGASPLMYVLADSDRTVLVGDFGALPTGEISETQRSVEFRAEVEGEGGAFREVRARGIVGRLAVGGPILLVARDMSAQDAAATRIVRWLLIGLGAGLLFALVAGLMAGRQAAQRAQELSNTARDVMAGDLRRRAAVTAGDDEFNRLAIDMNAMLDRLEQLVANVRNAGASIAHDLRSPLTRLRNHVESALANDPDNAVDRAALIKVADESDRMLAIFAALMQIAQMESRSHWDFEPVDLASLVQEFGEFYEPVAEERGIRLAIKSDEPAVIMGDPSLLGQAVSNLIENAIKFAPDGGAILVEARTRGDGFAEAIIEDNGPGIDPQDRARVVERFVRLEAHRLSPGAGLGLSLVGSIAQLHQGRLELRDARGSLGPTGLGATLVLPMKVKP